ncbi:methyltransferase type 11 [candidate division KSB1 bacterium 4484_87]|nr:MAG: methyltransferase type 11 [candidate division KSB1 bacterium 4484_87]
MATKVSTRDHWEKFWQERKEIDQVYSNDERIYQNLKQITNFENKKILEVGAGSGRDSLKLFQDNARVFVLDYAPQSLEIIRSLNQQENAALQCVQADAFQMPFPDGTFDIVFHQGLLEHFRDPLPLLKENFRILKPGGLLLVDVPQRYHFYTIIKHILIFFNKWFAGWETEFSVGELTRLMQKTGFETVHSYGNWMRPSLFYRIFREVFKKVGIQLPLYPRGFSPFRRIRDKVRFLFSKKRLAFYTFLDVGVIGKKKQNI